MNRIRKDTTMYLNETTLKVEDGEIRFWMVPNSGSGGFPVNLGLAAARRMRELLDGAIMELEQEQAEEVVLEAMQDADANLSLDEWLRQDTAVNTVAVAGDLMEGTHRIQQVGTGRFLVLDPDGNDVCGEMNEDEAKCVLETRSEFMRERACMAGIHGEGIAEMSNDRG
jgi:hypothetical protein